MHAGNGTAFLSGIVRQRIERLGEQLAGGPCTIFTSDLRVRVLATGLATYPDVTVVCGDLERDPEDGNGVVNPTLLVEVLSGSTEHYDRGEKAAHYRTISSLREYVFVSHRERRIERWWREGLDEWQSQSAGRGEVLRLAALGIDLEIDTVYERSPLTQSI